MASAAVKAIVQGGGGRGDQTHSPGRRHPTHRQPIPEEGRRLLHQLMATSLPIWLYPETDLIASFAPFNNLPTQYRIIIN